VHRPRDVFEALLADIGELGVDLAAHLAESIVRKADPAGLGDAFEPGGNIDAVTENVVALDQDVAEMDANAQIHSARISDTRIALHH